MLNILVISCSWAVFSMLYLFVLNSFDIKTTKIKTIDVKTRIISAIHGLFCIWYSTKEILQGHELGIPTSPFQAMVLNISVGYFIYDTIIMYIYGLYDKVIMIHHVTIVTFVSLILEAKYGGIEFMYGFFLTEITNPLLHFKCSLRVLNQNNTKLYLYAEISYAVLFLIARILFGAPLLVLVVLSHKLSVYHKILYTIMYGLAWCWFKDFIGVLKHRYIQFKKRRAEGIDLPWIKEISMTS